MRSRAFSDLQKLSDAEFFREVATGLAHIAKNVTAIDADARRLSKEKRGRGVRILDAFAAEEAGKYMILLDAVRCPHHAADLLGAQLKKAGQHLPKILYSELCDIRPATFAEVKRWVEMESQQYYLDGPSGADWIFRNRMVQSREDTLYVDYIFAEGDYHWNFPYHLDDGLVALSSSRGSVRMVAALSQAGFGAEAALPVIAEKWHPLQITDDTHTRALRHWNVETLEALRVRGLLLERPADDYSLIAAEWPFPLYNLPLKEIPVDPKVLDAQKSSYGEY
jgi:hypothetical protein